MIDMQGTGSTLLPDTRFLVTLDKGAEVTAYLPGRYAGTVFEFSPATM